MTHVHAEAVLSTRSAAEKTLKRNYKTAVTRTASAKHIKLLSKQDIPKAVMRSEGCPVLYIIIQLSWPTMISGKRDWITSVMRSAVFWVIRCIL